MNKKLVFTVGIALLVTAIGSGVYVLRESRHKALPTETSPIRPTAMPVVETTQWIDQSEFRFTYPKHLSLNPHDEDQVNFAHVELTDPAHPGRIIVWTKDTNAQTVDEWMKEQTFDGPIDTTLGNQPAKKVLIRGTTPRILLSTIRNGYLYQVEAELIDESYWNTIYDQIVSSYTFFSSETEKSVSSPQTNTAPPASSGESEEEIIE